MKKLRSGGREVRSPSSAIKAMAKQELLKAADPEARACKPWAPPERKGALGLPSGCLSKASGLVSL